LWVAAAALLAGVWPSSAGAQTTQTGAAALRGIVIDASTGAPLDGARVSLELAPNGLVTEPPPAASGLMTNRRIATGRDGTYAFEGLPPGRYRLRVERLGYRAASMQIHYDGPADPRVSVGLEVEPVQLEPMTVVTVSADPARSEQVGADASGRRRMAAERLRQARYLASDMRLLTDADAFEFVTLAEMDLLRGLHRLPGVAADDDWSAEPWVRGARWDETRVYFDGLPLLNPTHLGGPFTSVSPDAVASVAFHPGVRPVGTGPASAGVVDMRSRPAITDESPSVLTQISLLSGRLSVDAPLPGGGLRFSGRRSYLHEATSGEPVGDQIPVRFYDMSARWDQRVGDRVRLDVSGLKTGDRILGDLPETLKGTRADWGDLAGRATLEAYLGGLRARLTRGRSRFESEVWTVPWDPDRQDLLEAVVGADTWNRVTSDISELTLAPVGRGGRAPLWRVGVRSTDTRVDYRGPAPWPFPQAATAGSLQETTRVDRHSWWGELRIPLGDRLEVEAGASLETRDGRPWSDDVLALPRLQLAWTPTADWRVSVGLGRHVQYEQSLASTGFQIGPRLAPGHLWVSAEGDVPEIRSDLLTVGMEHWLPGGWLVSANGYARHSEGVLTPSPDSGYVRARPPVAASSIGEGWEVGESRTLGFEVGARRLAGRVTGSVSYSYSRARTEAGGTEFATLGSREHVLDGALVLQATDRTRIGAAMTAASGAPFTRFFTFRCQDLTWYCSETEFGDPPVIGFTDPAGAELTPDYVSLDLHVEKRGRLWSKPFGMYLQLKNALGRENNTTYIGSNVYCAEDDGAGCSLEDRFDEGFPTLPLIGFWVRW